MSHISSAHRNDSGIETNLCQTAYEVIAPNWHDRKCEKCKCVCGKSECNGSGKGGGSSLKPYACTWPDSDSGHMLSSQAMHQY